MIDKICRMINQKVNNNINLQTQLAISGLIILQFQLIACYAITNSLKRTPAIHSILLF